MAVFVSGTSRWKIPCFALGYKDYNPVSVDTDNVAAEYGISRLEQDEWAVRSHMNYGKAWKEGKFKDEMIPIEIPQKGKDPFILDIDEQYRADATVEKMSKLKPIYGCKAVTAGNAPGLNDGATAIIVMTRGKAQQMGLKPIGTILAMTSIAIHPNRMPEGPGFAIKKVLNMANLKLDQIDAIEINEAFAAVPLVSIEVVCDRDKAKAKETSQEDEHQRKRDCHRASEHLLRGADHDDAGLRVEKARGRICDWSHLWRFGPGRCLCDQS